MATYSQLVTRLSAEEKIYLLMYPEHASTIKKYADKAFAESKRRFGQSLTNGRGDAFRHCIWSAMLCREIGFVGALRYTTAHETFEANPPAEKAMDLHNNAVGLQIGRVSAPDELLIARSLVALRAGQLEVIG